MEDKHRNHIKDNIETLIKHTDYKKLMHACVAQRLLTPVMRQNIENIESPLREELTEDQLQHESHKRLFLKITKRGPDAYRQLRMILADLKCDAALGLLNDDDESRFKALHPRQEKTTRRPSSPETDSDRRDGPSHKDAVNGEHNDKLEEYSGPIQPKNCLEIKMSQRIHQNEKIGTYPMKSKDHRGVFLMVNIIDFPDKDERRNGAEEDAQSLLYLFQKLNFKLFGYTNLTQSEFFERLDDILNSDYTRDTECFVLALMTHGSMDEHSVQRVMFHDGSVVKVEDIEKRFEHHVCPNLLRKPKIFIFPFCRGDVADRGVCAKVQSDSFMLGGGQPSNISQLSDVIICYAALRGFKSHRDTENGSWYIQNFYKMMALHAHDTSFEDIIKIIQRETDKLRTYEGNLQTGNYQNIGFNKALYFNPGVWES